MRVYRVFPYVASAAPGDPGHPLSTGEQGAGRWDNPDRYVAHYFAASPAAAVGERFATLSRWRRAMLVEPQLPDGERSLCELELSDSVNLLDLDDPAQLAARGIRPTHVVIRDRQRTQDIAGRAFDEGFAGMRWWSRYHPEWTLYVLWDISAVDVVEVSSLQGSPALIEAGDTLLREIDKGLREPAG